MFSGIVQSIAEIVDIEDRGDIRVLRIRFPLHMIDGLSVGASVAVAGVCLTVTNIFGDVVSFDVMEETNKISNFKFFISNDFVNVERSLQYGDEIGGHLVSGHVHGVATIVSIEKNCFWFSINSSLIAYIFEKGFVALDGCSVTVVDVDRAGAKFSVCFIPTTLAQTTFGDRKIADRVNVEVDQTTKTAVDAAFAI